MSASEVRHVSSESQILRFRTSNSAKAEGKEIGETFLFAAPFEIPSQSNDRLAQILWPEAPTSMSASVNYTQSATSTSASGR
ncbi:hypothetical protein IAR55_005893 [Kwoniella newhampshirensis]|uniref:Uncharacterized protein n=1 Tax=Kwoniella newhampshirensis TaxID=1651941 RepID=A0AAW0YUY1_9TREE